MPNKEILEFVAGRLICGEVRDYLQRLQFRDVDVQYLESSGVFSRTFTIKASHSDMQMIKRDLYKWAKENDLLET